MLEKKTLSKRIVVLATTMIMLLSIGITALAATRFSDGSTLYGYYEGSLSSTGKLTGWCSAVVNADKSYNSSVYTSWFGQARTRLYKNNVLKEKDIVETDTQKTNKSLLIYAGMHSGVGYADAYNSKKDSFFVKNVDDGKGKVEFTIKHFVYSRGLKTTKASTSATLYY